jgi:hypothetical protein
LFTVLLGRLTGCHEDVKASIKPVMCAVMTDVSVTIDLND